MRTVWKVTVTAKTGVQRLRPARKGARPIALAEQAGKLAMWYELDPDADRADMEFAVVGTGWDVPDGLEHVDTAVCAGGAYIWHLYRRPV